MFPKKEYFHHASWGVVAVVILAALIFFQPADSLFSSAIDPYRLVWKLTLVLSAAWLAYHLVRSLFPPELRIPVLLKRCEEDENAVFLVCAVIMARVVFMGLVAVAVALGG